MEHLAIKAVSTKNTEPLRKVDSENEFLDHMEKQKDLKSKLLEDSVKSGAELSYSIHWTLANKPEVQAKELRRRSRRGK